MKHFKTVKQKHPKIKEPELKNMCKGILFTEKGRLNLTNRLKKNVMRRIYKRRARSESIMCNTLN